MAASEKHRWQFAPRFRRNAFDWHSEPAILRVRQAVAEIGKARRRDPVLAAGAVLFLERVSPALEHVDGSSGAIGSAVNRAIEQLVPLIASAPVDIGRRSVWLERLWEAYAAEAILYIETLGDFWGDLCANRQLASAWADALIKDLRRSWEQELPGHYFHGTTVCLSSLLVAERYQELLGLLDKGAICVLAVSALGCKGTGRNGKEARGARLCGSLAWADRQPRPDCNRV